MDGNSAKRIVCELGSTGQLLRRTLVVRSAPPAFRERLRAQLVADGRYPAVDPVQLMQERTGARAQRDARGPF